MSTETRFEDGNLIVTRTFEAPRPAVFEAWVETSKVQKWWGCAQTTEVRSEIEPRVGGSYTHHMVIDGQHEHCGEGTFTIYEPPERLAFESPMPGGAVMTVTVDFREVSGGTEVELVHAGIPDIEVDGGMRLREIVQGGWTAGFEKLGKFLEVGV